MSETQGACLKAAFYIQVSNCLEDSSSSIDRNMFFFIPWDGAADAVYSVFRARHVCKSALSINQSAPAASVQLADQHRG